MEWVVLSLVAGAEAVVLLLLTLPSLDGLRKGLIHVSQSILQPLLAGIPMALFLGLDIVWKLRTMAPHHDHPGDLEKYSKSIIKSQRNGLLVGITLFLYWLLYRVTRLQVRLESLTQQAAKLKRVD